MVHGGTRNILVSLAALIAASGLAFAGVKHYEPLEINVAGRFAGGGFADTHNTPDTDLIAECGSNATTGYCLLRDLAGTYYTCFTTDAAHLAVIRSMSPDSLFSIAWNASGVCTYVLSYASSRSAVRTP